MFRFLRHSSGERWLDFPRNDSDVTVDSLRLDSVDLGAPQGQQVKYSKITRSGWVQVMGLGTGQKGSDKHSVASFIENVKQRFR